MTETWQRSPAVEIYCQSTCLLLCTLLPCKPGAADVMSWPLYCFLWCRVFFHPPGRIATLAVASGGDCGGDSDQLLVFVRQLDDSRGEYVCGCGCCFIDCADAGSYRVWRPPPSPHRRLQRPMIRDARRLIHNKRLKGCNKGKRSNYLSTSDGPDEISRRFGSERCAIGR